MTVSGRRGDLSIETARSSWRFGGGVMLSRPHRKVQQHTPWRARRFEKR
jgi:hypothetical protein